MPATDPSFNADPAPDDIRSMLTASFDEAEKQEPDNSGDAPVEPKAEVTEPVEAPAIKDDHPTDPKRYADGSFKPTKSKEASAEPAAAPAKELPSTDKTAKASEPASTPAIAPPAGWTAAEKAEWSKLSPVAQAAVSRRETEIANGGKQWSEEKRRYEAMIAPVAESARARGLDASQGLQMLMAAQRALDTDPLNAIRHIARTYGVDLATLAGTQAAQGSPEASQPDIAALVRQAVQPMLAPIQQRYQAEEQQRQQQTVDFVTTFAESPGHEHFDAVQDELMAMIPAIKAGNPTWTHDKVLQEAYDRATFANPTTRTAIMAQRDADAEAKRVEAAKQRTNAAKRAGSSVTGSPSGAPAAQAKDSLRAELEAAWSGG